MTFLSDVFPIAVICALFLIGILLNRKLSPCSGQPGSGKPCLYCDCPRVSELYRGEMINGKWIYEDKGQS